MNKSLNHQRRENEREAPADDKAEDLESLAILVVQSGKPEEKEEENGKFHI